MAKNSSTAIRDFVKKSLISYYKNFQVKLADNPSSGDVNQAIKVVNGSIYINGIGGYIGDGNIGDASTLQAIINNSGGGGTGTDENVKQILGTGNNAYPVLTAPNTISSGAQITQSYYQPTLKINPEYRSVMIGGGNGLIANIDINNGGGAIAHGYTKTNAFIYSNGTGATAQGFAYSENSSIIALSSGAIAHGYTHGTNSYIKTDGPGAIAGGVTYGRDSFISSDGEGAVAHGSVFKNGYIYVSGQGSLGHGIVDGSNSYIEIQSTAGTAQGSITGDKSCIIVEGTGATAFGVIEGDNCNIVAWRNGSFAYGNIFDSSNKIEAYGIGSTAHGSIDGSYGVIKANGHGSHAEGYANGGYIYANGNGAHAEGYAYIDSSIIADGNGAHAEGIFTKAINNGAHAEGIGGNDVSIVLDGIEDKFSWDINYNPHRIICGFNIIDYPEIALNNYISIYALNDDPTNPDIINARIIGIVYDNHFDTNCIDVDYTFEYDLPEGSGFYGSMFILSINSQKASGIASHVEGGYNIANSSYGHAEGYHTVVSAEAAHAGGMYTIADVSAMTAIGQYNEHGQNNELFAIGNGNIIERSTVFKVRGDVDENDNKLTTATVDVYNTINTGDLYQVNKPFDQDTQSEEPLDADTIKNLFREIDVNNIINNDTGISDNIMLNMNNCSYLSMFPYLVSTNSKGEQTINTTKLLLMAIQVIKDII